MSIIKVENITKRFKDKLVLDNISFDIEEGEIFGLIGPNGAGKSTLINIITNLMMADSGNVFVEGKNLLEDTIYIKSIIGLVPQELAIIEQLTPYDNLEYFGYLYGLSGKLLKDRINEALEFAGLVDVKKKKISKLSGGMKRRLNLAIAILNHPKILILDEPTVGVDPQSRNHIFDFLRKLSNENNTTIIYTSHYMEEVEHLCSKIFIIDEGKEIASGTQDYLKSLVFSNKKLNIKIDKISGDLLFNLKNLKGVVSLEENENTCISLVVDEDFSLSNAISLIEYDKGSISEINYENPSLEDVFLNLTGKNLRD
ncbi:MAG: ABC transporter ATP-binding protein [Intestinibacter sp.]|uniref:ABC transporter ATP-binding protein n=1 Tax=Intestinibacter sp. TaxID=1965304 RepID=UPI0025C3C378|nr:ABC transporter ATP-binding protein [Intestinibacter sp.]MCI6737123.1 ABC transporter ATP-binding protein [Intestinibacter sp.]